MAQIWVRGEAQLGAFLSCSCRFQPTIGLHYCYDVGELVTIIGDGIGAVVRAFMKMASMPAFEFSCLGLKLGSKFAHMFRRASVLSTTAHRFA
jgi:hypothetical protein